MYCSVSMLDIAPPTDDNIPRLTCEFCNKLDVITNFARSRRFCSVTCSKRYSAYSQRKSIAGIDFAPGCTPAERGLLAAMMRRTKRGGGGHHGAGGHHGPTTQKLLKVRGTETDRNRF